MKTQILNSLSWTLKGMVARIVVALLLVLLALPVFYVGIFGMYALFSEGFAVEPTLVLITFAPVLVVLNVPGIILSFRHGLILAGALAMPYVGWAFTVYPFPGLAPNSVAYWAQVSMFAILCVNLAWIVWSLRERLALRSAA